MPKLVVPGNRELDSHAKPLDSHDAHGADERADGDVDEGRFFAVGGDEAVDCEEGVEDYGEDVKEEAWGVLA
jgi:hypothetical protein